MSKTSSSRLGQILLDKGLITAGQLDIAIKEQQKRRQSLDPFDKNLGVNSSLGEILIELGFIDRLQLRRGLNWQLMVRKMAIVMSFCAPLMTASYSAAASTSLRPTFTAQTNSSAASKVSPGFSLTKSSSSASSTPAVVVKSNSSSSKSSSISSIASSAKSSAQVESFSGFDTVAPKMPDKISVDAALYNRVQLSWNDATDEAGVVSYKIYRDQVQIDTLYAYQTTYIDFNVAPGKTYLYGISAGDDAGNWSPIKSIFVQTDAAPVTVSSSSQASSAASVIGNSSSAAAVSYSSASSKAASMVSSNGSSKAPGSASSNSSKAVSSVVSNGSSQAAGSVTSNSSSSAASSVASSTASSVASSTASVAGPVNVDWTAPTLRENGNTLDITEIGGYELRYRKVTDTDFTYVMINDAWKNSYNFSWLEGDFVFQIAAFDTNGNYSNFVDLTPH